MAVKKFIMYYNAWPISSQCHASTENDIIFYYNISILFRVDNLIDLKAVLTFED